MQKIEQEISTLDTILKLPKGNHRVVFLVNVGWIAALFCEHYFNDAQQLVCEYRFGQLKWRLVNPKTYNNISRLALCEEYKPLSQALEEAGYKVTSVLSCQRN